MNDEAWCAQRPGTPGVPLPFGVFAAIAGKTGEQLIEELPSREPRFILHSHELKHADGRVQYPLNLILYIPDGCGTNNRFTYASTANAVSSASGITRVSFLFFIFTNNKYLIFYHFRLLNYVKISQLNG